MKTLILKILFPVYLELASNNDIKGFKLLLDKEGASSINEARTFDTIGKMGLIKLFVSIKLL
jgi:hypothetical protein